MKRQNIQILRILACLGVFIVHLGQRLEPRDSIRFFMDYGAMGVYLFFLISGYVAFMSFDKISGKVKVLQYYLIRFARILPVYYVVILCQFIYHTYILCDIPIDETGIGWARYIFCISRWIPSDDSFWSNLNSTWTIGAFLLFYLAAPFLYRYIKNYNIALARWIVGYLIAYAIKCYLPGWLEPVTQMQYFLFGIVIYYIEKERKAGQGIFFYLVNLVFIMILAVERQCSIWILAFGMLVLASRSLSVSNRFVRRCIDILEEYSYSVYLIHVTVMDYVDRWKLDHTENWRIQAFLIIVFGSTAGVFLVHNLIEKPLNRSVRRYAGQWIGYLDLIVNKSSLVKRINRIRNLEA